MSGEIEVKVRAGKSKDTRYDEYTEWYLEITGEDGTKISISPSFPDLRKMLRDIALHEFRVDATRTRNKDMIKQMKKVILDDNLVKEAQTDFDAFNIPEIYHKINKLKSDKSTTP